MCVDLTDFDAIVSDHDHWHALALPAASAPGSVSAVGTQFGMIFTEIPNLEFVSDYNNNPMCDSFCKIGEWFCYAMVQSRWQPCLTLQ